MDIPKPVKKEVLEKDLRLQYLQEWKSLFEEIGEGIQVTLYNESTFKDVLDALYGNIEFEYSYYSDARIVVTLPSTYGFSYLICMTNDEMFSESEVLSDKLIHEDPPYPCEPKTKKWSEFYATLCTFEKISRKEIQPPPKST